jgi:hypothetical protein
VYGQTPVKDTILMRRDCLFCGGTPLTKEHIWPRWVRDEVAGDPASSYELTSQDANSDEPGFRERARNVGPRPGVTAKLVCGGGKSNWKPLPPRTEFCNDGWMSRLEGEARLILLPLIRGQSSRLRPVDQLVIAAWTAKMAYVFEAYTGYMPLTTSDDLELLRTALQPPATARIRIAAHKGTTPLHYVRQVAAEQRRPGAPDGVDQHVAYTSTFAIGSLVLQFVYSLNTWYAFPTQPLVATADYIPVFPPTTATADFPTARVLSDTGFLEFSESVFQKDGKPLRRLIPTSRERD